MPDLSPLALTAIAIAACLVAIMVFFAAIVTPAIFRTLGREAAGPVVRALFPKYYLGGAGLAGTAAILAGIDCALAPAILLGATALLFTAERFVLLPVIDRYRPGRLAGEPEATRRFGALHRLSVFLNMGQLLASAAAAAWLAV